MSPVRLTMRPRLRGDGGAYQIVAQAPEARECALLVGAGEPAVADDVRTRIAAIFRVSAMARPTNAKENSTNVSERGRVMIEKD
jgi:hypothetical protein